MTTVVTERKDGSYDLHRDTCRKIEGRPTYTVAESLEMDPQKATQIKAASCCKPSLSLVEDAQQTAWDFIAEHRLDIPDNTETENTNMSETTENTDVELDDVDTEGDVAVDEDEDLLGEAPAEEKPKKPRAPRLSPEQGQGILDKVADLLDLELAGPFEKFGKSVKTTTGQSVYLHSGKRIDIWTPNADQAKAWAEEYNGTLGKPRVVTLSTDILAD